jgi:hypothetical protein
MRRSTFHFPGASPRVKAALRRCAALTRADGSRCGALIDRRRPPAEMTELRTGKGAEMTNPDDPNKRKRNDTDPAHANDHG